MKKVLLIAAIIAGTAAMTSCKKEFQCDCSGSFGNYEKTGKGKTADEACADAAEKILGIPQEVCEPV